MPDPRVAIAVTTWTRGHMLQTTLAHLPAGIRHEVIDTRANNWPLSRGWNYGIDKLLSEGYEAVIVMNDDVVLRHDTADLLAWALLDGQFITNDQFPPGIRHHESLWPADRPEFLLIGARHASPSDRCTDDVDWPLLDAAKPKWEPGPDFACFCVGRKLFEAVGRFDEEFAAYFEDNDMHRRIQLAGYEGGAFAPYWHFRNGTIRTDAERQSRASLIYENSRAHYCAKWGAPYDDRLPLGRETFAVPFGGRVGQPA
jgi:GT2 family glycosyltransferase